MAISVPSAESCLDYSIFIFLAQILHDDCRRSVAGQSQVSLWSVKGQSQVFKLSQHNSSYSRSLKYFVLFFQKILRSRFMSVWFGLSITLFIS